MTTLEHASDGPTPAPPSRLASPVRRLAGGIAARLQGSVRVWAVTFVLMAMAGALLLGPLADAAPPVASFSLPWWSLAAMFLLAELHIVTVRIGEESQSFSLNEVAVVLGLFFASPLVLVAGQLAGAALPLAVHRRQEPHKLAFNLSLFAVSSCVASAVFHSLVRLGEALGPPGWGAALAGALVSLVVTLVLLVTAVSLFMGTLQLSGIVRTLAFGVVATTANTCLALFGVTILATDSRAAWLLVVPLGAVAVAYRSYTREQERRIRVQTLHQAMDTLGGTPDVEPGVIALLGEARKIFRTDIAEITLLPRTGDDRVLRTTMGPGDQLTVSTPDVLTVVEQNLLDAVAERRSLHVVHERASGPLAEWGVERGFADAMVTSLRDATRQVGTLLVADRARGVTAFADEELVFLETFASAAAVSLQNGRLEESLTKLTEVKEQYRHEAFHDPLTQLANRSLFAERLQRALDRRATTGHDVAVLYIDLDDFKSVNDSRGHAAGDRVLTTVARRLVQALELPDTAARLGGDEFAVLLEDVYDPGRPATVADRLSAALAVPIDIGGQHVTVGASIGLAFSHGAEMSVDDVLRDADVAMYSAKGAGKGRLVLFEAQMHRAVLDRHDLSLDLRGAVDRGEFFTVFQPIVELADGRVSMLEALVRWRHPERGVVPPDEFIGLAEDVGMMVPLGRFVLEDACRRTVAWRRAHAAHADLAVTVNVSARQLADDRFVADVERVLTETGLPPAALVLEVTETVAMQDPQLAQQRLEGLSALGLRLAVDDFGTGYSSLARLRTFPLDLLKIAKPFVDDVADAADGAVVAELVLRLADALGLDVVAEGIETPEQAARLHTLGCRLGQGYHYARPLSVDGVAEALGGDPNELSAAA